MSYVNDTIAAIATAPGVGSIGVVRVSGPAARAIAEQMLQVALVPNLARYLAFRDPAGSAIDQGIALFFAAPNSFTGEDILELQGHGGPVVMHLLLKQALVLGARLARPGEFSERAFLNDKLDLAQAEAIADLIGSATESAARAAARSLAGAFSREVHALAADVTALRAWVEGAIDFPTDEIDFLAGDQAAARVRNLAAQVSGLLGRSRHGRLLRDGLALAIVGRPNAGKSSLLNLLSGRDAAIVTAQPGTTRDVLREHIALDGIPLHLVDTAGLRESADEVESEGVRRALAELETADHILLIHDATDAQPLPPLPATAVAVTEVWNKIDLTGQAPSMADSDAAAGARPRLHLSVKTGAGIDLLKTHLKTLGGASEATEGQFLARARHVAALERVAEHLAEGLDHLELDGAGELLAEELRLAGRALGEITGTVTTEDLLGQIFSSFCIGK